MDPNSPAVKLCPEGGQPEVPHPPGDTGLWSAVREALRGSHRDYTRGPVGRSILVLSVPMILEMLMESVFAVADVFFVAKLGPDAVAPVTRPSPCACSGWPTPSTSS